MLRHNESYSESDSFALNQKDVHPNFSKDSFWHLFHFFFSLFPQLSTFIFDIKMKIECEGDQYTLLYC